MAMSPEDEEVRWIEPQAACSLDAAGPVLTPEQRQSWREAGFALVNGLLPNDLVERAGAIGRETFPLLSRKDREGITDFGSRGSMEFPTGHDAVDGITLHPRILGAVSELLDQPIRDIRLTQSDLWPKFGRTTRAGGAYDNTDQRIHVDYPNHTLTHPPRWENPEAVEIILYFDAVEDCGGATAVVPREGTNDPAYAWPIVSTPGVGAIEWINDRTKAEKHLGEVDPNAQRFRAENLYPRERRARFAPGTALFYRHDTWHRGTPLKPDKRRLVHNLTFRKASSEWISVLHSGWAWKMYQPGMVLERLIAQASVDQRCVLGFPAPGHAYWTPETVEAIRARYGPLGMDVAPYLSGSGTTPRLEA
jgi:hypothetical protein